ncbi:MAG: lysophospholipid acyltransferase family protein [Pontibacterium sp.]
MGSRRPSIEEYSELVIARIIRYLPIIWVSAIGAFLGRSRAREAIKLKRKWIDRLHRNFEQLEGITEHSQREVRIMDHMEHMGRLHTEYTVLHRMAAAGRLHTRGHEHLAALKKPVIFISAHTGHWELLAEILQQHKVSTAFLYEAVDNPIRLKLAMEARTTICPIEKGYHFIPASNLAAREMVAWITDGGNLLIFIDEYKDNQVWCPPLGRKLPFSGNRAMVSRLAIKHQMDVIPLHVQRTKGAFFEASIEAPVSPPEKGAGVEARIRFADQLSDFTERWIREDISHWYWLAQLELSRPFPDNKL